MGQDTRTGPMPRAQACALFAQGLNGGRGGQGGALAKSAPALYHRPPHVAARPPRPGSTLPHAHTTPRGASAMNAPTLYRPPPARRFPLVRSRARLEPCLLQPADTDKPHGARRGQGGPWLLYPMGKCNQGGILHSFLGGSLRRFGFGPFQPTPPQKGGATRANIPPGVGGVKATSHGERLLTAGAGRTRAIVALWLCPGYGCLIHIAGKPM